MKRSGFHRTGFTLIEMLISIAILLIMVSLSAALLNTMMDNDRIRSSARQTQSAIAGAKDRALRAGRDIGQNAGNQRGLRFTVDDPPLGNGTRTISSFLYVQQLQPWKQGTAFVDSADPNSQTVWSNGGAWGQMMAQGLITPSTQIQLNNDGRFYGINMATSSPSQGMLMLTSSYLNPPAFVTNAYPWQGNTPYLTGVTVVPYGIPSQFAFQLTAGGTSGFTEPNWSVATVLGQTVTDGTGGSLTWTAVANPNVPVWNYKLTLGNAVLPNAQPLALSSGVTINLLQSLNLPDSSLGYFDIMFSPRGMVFGPVAAKGLIHFYLESTEDVILSGPNAATSWALWQQNTPYTAGQVMSPFPNSPILFTCTTAGTSGGSAPTWANAVGSTVSDGGVTWASTISMAKDKLICTLNTVTGNVSTYPVNVGVPDANHNIDPFLYAKQGSTAGR